MKQPATVADRILYHRSSTAPLRPGTPMSLRVGLIGHGAVGSVVAKAIQTSTHGLSPTRITLVAVLVQTSRDNETLGECLMTNDPTAFFQVPFDVCVECAGQQAVRQHAVAALERGQKFLCTSIGALTDDALMQQCEEAAIRGNSQFQLAAGAMPGLDWMSSSALEPGSVVTAVQTKPPISWIGARYEPGTSTALPDVVDFKTLVEPTIFFEGTAREAASYYPKNSNVLAMLALSTCGLDECMVQLIADPVDQSMRQVINYEGSAGKLTLQVCGKKSPSNPKTSQVVPLSVIKALRNMSAPVGFGL